MSHKPAEGFKVCQQCNEGPLAIVDSRPTTSESGLLVIRRRRVCLKCKYRWSTYEISAEDYRRLVAGESGVAVVFIKSVQAQLGEWLEANDLHKVRDIDGIDRKHPDPIANGPSE
jgi:transcriptional regulator NrdR family protein